MKKIKFTCSNCHASLRVPTHLAGVSAPCPKCGAIITAPTDLDNVVDDDAPPSRRSSSATALQRSGAAGGSAAAVISRPAHATGSSSGSAATSPSPGVSAQAEASASPPAAPQSRSTAESKVEPQPVPVPLHDVAEESGSLEDAPPLSVESRVSTPHPEEPGPAAESPSDLDDSAPQPIPSQPEESILVEETILTPSSAAPSTESIESLPQPPPLEQPVIPVPVPLTPPPPTFAGPPEPGAPTVEEVSAAAASYRSDREGLITEPIQILPGNRAGTQTGDGGLSVSGEVAESGEAPETSATGQARNRLQLDRMGEEYHSFSPDDFIVPAGAPASPADAPDPAAVPPGAEAQGYYGEPPAETGPTEGTEMPPDLPPQAPVSGSEEFDYPAVVPQMTVSTVPTVPTTPPPAGPGEEGATPNVPPVPEGNLPAEPDPREAAAPAEVEFEGLDEIPPGTGRGNSLSEGSFEQLFARQSGGAQSESEDQLWTGSSDSPAGAPGGAAYHPGDFEAGAPQSQDRAEAEIHSARAEEGDFDVLGELRGTAGEQTETGGLTKSTRILIILLIAVAVIAVAGVYLVGRGLGFWSDNGRGDPSSMIPPPPEMTSSDERAPGPTESEAVESVETTVEGEVPARIDPVAEVRRPEGEGPLARSTVSLPGDTSAPVRIVDSGAAPAGDRASEDATASPGANEGAGQNAGTTQSSPVAGPGADPEGLSFDERVQQIVGRSDLNPNARTSGSVIGGEPTLDPIEGAVTDFTRRRGEGGGAGEGGAAASALSNETARPAKNYNPADSFPAPGPDDGPLGKTHDLLDAFLRAPDWETRLKYSYQGESLRAAVEEYHKKWPVVTMDRFSQQLFQIEDNVEAGGPYWVYLISTSDADQGYPVIIRVEDGNLKVDWEIYAEFQDRHFAEFQKGSIASPHTFRLVIERVSDYFGPDRDQFATLDEYYVYQINPPYGDVNEHSDYAFVKKDSDIAKKLDGVVGLTDEPLAVIITLEQTTFPHGVKHLTIKDYVTEGWFR